MKILILVTCLSFLCFSSGCQDQYPEGCKQQIERCFSSDESILKTMREVCPQTCNACDNVVSAPIQRPLPAATSIAGARLSPWSKWTTCPSESCDGRSRRRSRQCAYEDGRPAPTNMCSGVVDQVVQCSCGTIGDSKEESTNSSESLCADGSPMCSTFSSLCNSSDIFKKTLCPLTCKQCTKNEPVPVNLNNEKGVCRDQFASCKHRDITHLCNNPNHTEALSTYCPVTCDLCAGQRAPETVRPVCKDKYPAGCSENKLTCTDKDEEVAKEMHRLCPVTCGSCGEIGTANTNIVAPVPLQTTLSSTATACRNKYPGCEEQKLSCTNGDAKDMEAMRNLCPVTCGTCGLLTGAAPEIVTPSAALGITLSISATVCEDKYPGCAAQQLTCTTGDEESIKTMHRACPVTCGTCGLSETLPPTAVAPTAFEPTLSLLAECKDKYTGCVDQKLTCTTGDEENRKTMHKVCPVTCGTCGLPKPLPPATATPTAFALTLSTSVVCKDEYPGCAGQKLLCTTGDEESKKTMHQVCSVTCGTCELYEVLPPSTVAPTSFELALSTLPACRNRDPKCEELKTSCSAGDEKTKEIMGQLCPVTCGTCGLLTTLLPATAAPREIEFTLSTTSTGQHYCKNKLDDATCQKYQNLCADESSGWAKLCRLTCRTCEQKIVVQPTGKVLQGVPTPTVATQKPVGRSPQCRDHLEECPAHPELCARDGSGWLDACLITCGLC